MKIIESIPNAERTFQALRSLGYDLNSSVADIVDNSITEKANGKNIAIIFRRENNSFICRIKDDGNGMTDEQMEEAMRIGADTSYGKHDLGKYGMGMKTASLSHCDILTVVSKTKKSEVSGYRWDMSHVATTGKWSLLKLTPQEIKELFKKEQCDISKSGTIVFWDKMQTLDREYSSCSSPKQAEDFYYKILGDLKLYIRMIFHRFISGEAGADRKIKITINGGSPLSPWDPFCRDEKNTIPVNLKKEIGEFKLSESEKPVVIRGYALPDKDGFSSRRVWEEAKGLESWNDAQGYYIYRANRLIRYGGWHGVRVKDEHDKLARISIDIDPTLDKYFRITVNKKQLEFPEKLFLHLKANVNPRVVILAEHTYRKSGSENKVKNPVRDKMPDVADVLVRENKIKIKIGKGIHSKEVAVSNPAGIWLSNKIKEFFEHGDTDDFEIVSEKIDSEQLWRVVCNEGGKFKVIINMNHPFYNKIYASKKTKPFTKVIDALFFSLAFSELYNRNEKNSHLLDTFKDICSLALERMIKEGLI